MHQYTSSTGLFHQNYIPHHIICNYYGTIIMADNYENIVNSLSLNFFYSFYRIELQPLPCEKIEALETRKWEKSIRKL